MALAPAQIVLDPKNPQSAGTISYSPLPEAVRTFGFIPDMTMLRPGDVILTSPLRSALFSNTIVKAQAAGGFPPDHARWTHAAVYIGDHNVVEAVLAGVQYTPIYKYIGTHFLRVRRDLALAPEHQYEIAIKALTRIRSRYSVGALPQILISALRGLWQPVRGLPGSRAVICSQLYADAYTEVTRKLVTNALADYVTPAHLSDARNLNDVAVPWLKLI